MSTLKTSKANLRRYENLNNQQNLTELDISKINLQADSYFYEMLDDVRSDKISALEGSAENFSDKMTAKQILINGNIDFSEKIASLKSEIASLRQKSEPSIILRLTIPAIMSRLQTDMRIR